MPKISELKTQREIQNEKAQQEEIIEDALPTPPPDMEALNGDFGEGVSEDQYQDSIYQTKRDVLDILKEHVKQLRDNPSDIKNFRQIQQLFDSLWKQEVARENMIIKRRSENRADSMAIFDIYGRFGMPDQATLASMRQELYGENPPQLKGHGSTQEVDVSQPPNSGTPIPQGRASSEGQN